MRHTRLTFAALSCLAVLLAACDQSTVVAPESPQAALCSWDGECGPGDRDPPTDTTAIPPVVAEYNYWSDILTSSTWLNGTMYKKLQLRAHSEAIRYVSSMRVDATFRQGPSCNPEGTQFLANRAATGTGSPLKIKAVLDTQYVGSQIKTTYVEGSHAFTPVAGGTGGGTFPSSASKCL